MCQLIDTLEIPVQSTRLKVFTFLSDLEKVLEVGIQHPSPICLACAFK